MNPLERWLALHGVEALNALDRVLENPVFLSASRTIARAVGAFFGIQVVRRILHADDEDEDKDEDEAAAGGEHDAINETTNNPVDTDKDKVASSESS